MFCSDPNEEKCTGDNYAKKGKCNLATFSSSLSSHFQYFSDPRKGGRNQISDFCPQISAYRYLHSHRVDVYSSHRNLPIIIVSMCILNTVVVLSSRYVDINM